METAAIHKVPPQSLEAEQCVLGAILKENEALSRVLDILQDDQFYSGSHRKIFQAMLDLFERSEPIDLLTLQERLRARGEIEAVGGVAYLASLTDMVPTAANVRFHSMIVREKYVLRALIQSATEIVTQSYEEGENELGLKILSLHGLLKIVFGKLDATSDAILDRALVETYRQKGITVEPNTQKNTPPLMEDLYKVLLGMEDQKANELALVLEKFIKGSLSGIFNQQSNFDIKNPFTVFNIKGLEEELRPIAMHIVLDFVWTKIRKDLKKRLLILDEAWYMMEYEDSASFVYSIAKRARKYYLGLTTATQDVEDFLSTDYGKAVLSNSSIQMLLKQAPSEVDLVSQVFYLTKGEKQLLLSAQIGEGLFFAGQNHVAIQVLAAEHEHALITTDPQEAQSTKQDTEKSAITPPEKPSEKATDSH